VAGVHTEAWRQKLAGKGRETGSQTEASKQAKIDVVRER
jgi:hypothetical protein